MKSYGQFCGLARSLDHVGDRWTLLILRELLIQPAGYGDLLAALDGIATNLLAERLRRLEQDGLIARKPDPDDRRRALYALTVRGRALEPAMLALISWGTQWMRSGPGDDVFQPRWTALALRALVSGRAVPRRASVDITVGGLTTRISSSGDGPLRVGPADHTDADARVTGPPELILGVLAGETSLDRAALGGLAVDGDRRRAQALLEP